MNRTQKFALQLAVVPMLLGVTLLLTWLAVEWQPLIYMGYGSLLIGLFAAFAVPLLLYRALPQTQNQRATIALFAVALLNLPVTFVCVDQGLAHYTRYTVVLQNDADNDWRDVHLVSTDLDVACGDVLAGKRLRFDLHFQNDGSLKLTYLDGQERRLVDVEGYVTNGMGGAASVVRAVDGAVSVRTP